MFEYVFTDAEGEGTYMCRGCTVGSGDLFFLGVYTTSVAVCTTFICRVECEGLRRSSKDIFSQEVFFALLKVQRKILKGETLSWFIKDFTHDAVSSNCNEV